jgi:hypothetical protein
MAKDKRRRSSKAATRAAATAATVENSRKYKPQNPFFLGGGASHIIFEPQGIYASQIACGSRNIDASRYVLGLHCEPPFLWTPLL